MPKQSNKQSSDGNGGIMGSGIFGLFGTTIQCPASDTSLFCTIMKFFNVFMVILLVAFILYTGYSMYRSAYPSKRR